MKRVGIIGAGASGMAAAIAAAENGASVFLFENKDRVGKKLLLTGNGKCNLTNVRMGPGFFHSSSDEEALIESVLRRFGCEDTIMFFGHLGIFTRNREGRIYPYPETASCVLDALRLELRRLKVKERVLSRVSDIRPLEGGGFELDIKGERSYTERVDSCIICSGGKTRSETGSDGSGYALARHLGHRVIRPLPALTGLKSGLPCFKALSGVRAEAALKLFIDAKEAASSSGELQLTDYGISGICTFDISGAAVRALNQGRKATVSLDFMPEFNYAQARTYLKQRFEDLRDRSAVELLNGLFHKKLNQQLLKLLGIKERTPYSELPEDLSDRLCALVKDFRADISGYMGYDRAQVTSGGVALNEVTEFLESKLCPGLFLAGEVLDVDGVCGGYNLQWAFASGIIAGRSSVL